MAAPSFSQIQSFNKVSEQLRKSAIEEFQEYVYDGMTVDEMIDAASTVAMKYSYLGCELGAQWYDLCSELAGIDVEPAEYGELDPDNVREYAQNKLNANLNSEPTAVFNSFLQDMVNNSIRETGNANLWRDYERGIIGGKWARVPVGDTCAWCLMLASQGAWYVSKKSALGETGDHYHDGCNCIAVYHADAESIAGYKNLERYKTMYYDAENMREANDSGKTPYPDELAERINTARTKHEADYDAGNTEKRWTPWNETLIIMRYQNGLK